MGNTLSYIVQLCQAFIDCTVNILSGACKQQLLHRELKYHNVALRYLLLEVGHIHTHTILALTQTHAHMHTAIIGASAMRDVFSRSESSGVEMLTATGPLSQPVTIIVRSYKLPNRECVNILCWVQLKDVLEGAPNVSYQYHYTELSNIPYTSNTTLPVPDTAAQFGWTTGCYGPCSTSCGGGMSIAHPKCIDKVFPDRTLPDQFCDSATKPSPRVRKCNTESCPPR